MPVCVIFNPVARGEKARLFREQLARLPAGVTLRPTPAAGAGRTLAAQAVAEGFDTIIAAGGDGTVNEVLNGLADAPQGLERARLGVLPLGTVNVFARELGLPLDFTGAWRVLEAGRERRVDLPEVEFTAEDGRPVRRAFAQLAGAGLDARAIERVDWEQKKRIGPLAYVLAGFNALAGDKPVISAAGDGRSGRGELVLIGNGRFYGGHFNLFPQARLDDGLLDVTLFPRADLATLARAGWGWLTDAVIETAGAATFQARSVTLGCEGPASFQLDGDIVGRLPATFRLRPGALRVLAV